MKSAARLLLVSALLVAPRIAHAAPVTNPDDPRNWQGATVETFRALFGYATRQDMIDAQLLDDDIYPRTAAYAATFSVPGAPCGSQPPNELVSIYIGGVEGCSGYSYDPNGYGYSCGDATLADYSDRGRCLDMWWIQDGGDGDVATGNKWDLGGDANQVAVFPIIDHTPLPQEAIEYSVYLSNNPLATTEGTDGNTSWVPAKLVKVYLEGWIKPWVADGFTTVWKLPGDQIFRYVNVVSGGHAAIQHDGDDEIDAVMGLTKDGDPVATRHTSWGTVKVRYR